MLFSNEKDYERCKAIIKKELEKRQIMVNEAALIEKKKNVMNISYSIGGDYSDHIIQSIAETYIESDI
jgi:hypothetical protein